MMRRQGALMAVLGLTVAVLLNGCSDQSSNETTTPAQTSVTRTSEPVVTSETPDDVEPTATASPELSAEEQDEADIDKTLRLYTDALSAAFNADASVEGIYPFSRDTARDKWVTEVMAAEAQGIAFRGLMRVEIIEVSISGDTAVRGDIARETKTGYIRYTGRVRDQVLKDVALKADGAFTDVHWHFVASAKGGGSIGADKELLDLLDLNGIPYTIHLP